MVLDWFVGLGFGVIMACMQGFVGEIKLAKVWEMGVLAAISGALSAGFAPLIPMRPHYAFMLLSIIFPLIAYLIIAKIRWKTLELRKG